MRQKIFFLFLFLFGFLTLLPLAQTYALVAEAPIKSFPVIPPIKNTNQTLFGENQYYTVVFRGNGEAVVTMKAILTNTASAPLSSITVHIPSYAIRDITAYQVLSQPQCVQYSNELIAQPKCLQYQAPDYQYVNDNTTYKKISIGKMNDTLMLSLPTALNTNDTGSYLLSYKTLNYAHKNLFGAYDFVFQTLKVDDQINTLQIGITTDSDLYLKNAKGTVNYNTTSSMMALPKTADTAIQSSRFNEFYNQIGQGTIQKNVSNLSQLESYTIKGTYADVGIKLYGKEISITVLSILLFILLILGLAKIVLRIQGKTKTAGTNTALFFIAAGISFGSVFLATLYTIGVMLVSLFVNTNNYYFAYNNIFLSLLIISLSGAVYLFLLFTPSVIMTVKKGFIWGSIMFGLTIMWTVISCVVLFGIFYLFFASNSSPQPIIQPFRMGGAAGGVSVQNKVLP